MARYLRRTAFYKLNPPTVVAPPAPFVASPVQATLSKWSVAKRVFVHYQLRPPVVVATPTTFVARSIQTELARSRRPVTTSELWQPAVVNPAVTNYGPQRKLAPHPRQARAARYVLRPPATLVAPVVPFVARGVKTHFGTTIRRSVQQHFFTSQLYPPEIIDPLPVTFGPQTKLTRTPRQARVTRSVLRRPVVSGVVVVTPPFRPLAVNFVTAVRRSARKRPALSSELRPPTVVSIPSGDNPTGGIFDPNYFLIIHS